MYTHLSTDHEGRGDFCRSWEKIDQVSFVQAGSNLESAASEMKLPLVTGEGRELCRAEKA